MFRKLQSLLLLDDQADASSQTPDEPSSLSAKLAEPTEVDKLRAADTLANRVGVTDTSYIEHLDKLGEQAGDLISSSSSSSDSSSTSDGGDSGGGDAGGDSGTSDGLGDMGGMDMGNDGGSDGDATDPASDTQPADDATPSEDTPDDTKTDGKKTDDAAKKDDTSSDSKPKDDKKPADKPADDKKKDEEKPAPEKSEGIDDAKPAQESLRDDVQDFSYVHGGKTLYPYLGIGSFALEAIDQSVYTDRKFHDGPAPIEKIGSYAWDKAKQFGGWLKQMGLEYGPQVLSALGEGVAFIMGKSARMLISSMELVRRYVNTIGLNFNKLEKEVDTLIAHVTMASESGHKRANGAFEKEKTINMLLIGNSFDIDNNVKAMTKFVDTYIAGLDKIMREEFKLTMHVMDMDATSAMHDISGLLNVAHIGTVLKPGDIAGYEVKNPELLAGYTSPTSGMGNIRVCAHVPKQKLETAEQFRSAYQKSTMFVAMDMHGAKSAQRIEYIDADRLLVMLQNLKVLCGKCKQHQKFYKETENNINSLSTKMKTFFGGIVNSKKRLDIQDTTMELVYLKMGFIDRVYIPCAMDLHDYTAKVVASAIDYSKHCLKSYT